MYGPDPIHRRATSSHVPFTQGVISAFPMNFALEQGSGRYSTPVLRQFIKRVVSAENSPSWAKIVAEQFPDHEFRQPPPQCAQVRPPHTLSPAEWAIIADYYTSLDKEFADLTPRLLFSDGCSCERVPMINAIHAKYDMMIIHDTDYAFETSRHYDFSMINTTYTGYHYEVSPICGLDMPATTLFARNPLSDTQVDALEDSIHAAILQYCELNQIDISLYSYSLSPVRKWGGR